VHSYPDLDNFFSGKSVLMDKDSMRKRQIRR